MNKSEFELKSLAYIVLSLFGANLLFGIFGFLLQSHTFAQNLFYQLGNASAIAGCTMAARYVGSRGEQVSSSGFVLLAITHGISLAALNRVTINEERAVTMIMPMIPALLAMFWCSIFPKWLRYTGIIPITCFSLVFVGLHLGYQYFRWPLHWGYGTLQVIEVLWAWFIYRDWKNKSQ